MVQVPRYTREVEKTIHFELCYRCDLDKTLGLLSRQIAYAGNFDFSLLLFGNRSKFLFS